MKYAKWHTDINPMLYVLWSDATDTFGLNMHYLPSIFSSKAWKYRRLTLTQTAELMLRLRKHPALRIFFDFVEKPAFDSMNFKSKLKILKLRWPRLMDIMYRHYKTRYILIIEQTPKTFAESFFNTFSEFEDKESTMDVEVGPGAVR